jgi:Fungal specific transcription factor domain
MESYFANMTAFSLFRPGSIETKLALMRSRSEAEALLAAIFSFSARFSGCQDFTGSADESPAPSYFAHIAMTQLEKALDEYGDTTPALWVLQANILIAFYHLTRSARSKSWRVLGGCIRLAYDMRLHLVDANHDYTKAPNRHDIDIRRWSQLEERRRAWWAIWELDVFASTIRRLPTAIDWSQNMTLLPVHDNCWFNDIYQESRFLSHDPSLRWKCLAESGNNSPRAWFIVINSLMRNTQLLVYPLGSALTSPHDRRMETKQDDLNIMANNLYCATISLPPELSYSGESLDFRTKYSARDLNIRQYHADKYSFHLMVQLSRFMIHHHKILAQAPWLAKEFSDDSPAHPQQASPIGPSEWSNYINAADEIVTLIRNCSKEHYKYANPFLMNTIWFAGAAQCAIKVFGPSSFDKRVTESNLALLRLTIDRYIAFWQSAETLSAKLGRMEAGLKSLMGKENSSGKAAKEAPKEMQIPHSRAGIENNSGFAFTPSASDTLNPYHTPTSDQTLPHSALDATNDSMAIPFVPPGLNEFSDPFGMLDQTNPFLDGQVDYFPYGLEEILMYGGS